MSGREDIKECRDCKDAVLKRLNRIEGQIKGIQKMVVEEKNCIDILTQVAAVRSAINKVGSVILEEHSKACIRNLGDHKDKDETIDELLDTIQKFLKFVD